MVYDITQSTLAVGLLGLCELVPVFVFPIGCGRGGRTRWSDDG